MSELYGFRKAPTYRGATVQERYETALSQPMSLASTFFDQAKGGVLESFGLGTAIRDITTPEGVKPEPTGDAYTDTITRIDEAISPRNLAKRIIGTFDNDQPPMSKEAYEASEYARDGVPWDASMTEDRAASLAMAYDAKRVREFYAEKRPITSFVANLAGQATDPINYIPIAGPAVRAAAVARTGRVAGLAATASLDAAANTAIFGLGTASQRRQFGDDVSWQATVSQIATAALIGGAFGTIAGALGSRADATSRMAIEERLSTLKTTQEARIALNEGIDALVRAEDVALSPNATAPLRRIASEMDPIEFSRWADGTKLVDEKGNPLVLYHQTAKENVASIERGGFDLNRVGARGSDEGVPDGVFLKTTKDNIGVGSVDGASQMEVYAAIRNPLVVADRDALASVLMKDTDYATLKREADALDARLAREYDELYERLDEKAVADGKRSVGKNDEIDQLFERGNAELREAAGKARAQATEVLREQGFDGVVLENDAGSFGRSVRTIIAFDPEQTRLRSRTVPTPDTSGPRPEPIPEGRKQAESRIAKPDDYKALAAQYRVDPETGSFAEEADITQLGIEGRLTEEDLAVLADSQMAYEDGAAYGEALRSVANCLI